MNSRNKLMNFINEIEPLDEKIMKEARVRVDSLAKPLGSLGKLEDIAIKLSGITGKLKNSINKKCIIVLSSDNGVVEEGVASAPQYVTLAQTINFTKGLTGVAVLAKENNTDVIVVDVGVNTDEKIYGAINRKIRKGTNNIAKEAAMSYEECINAINVGIEMVEKAYAKGYDILGVGEMGIGNTTTSSAVLIALTGCEVKEAVGKGAGVTKEAFEKKKRVVKKALDINKPNKDNPIDVLSKVGGFDIAAMTGVFIGAAHYKIPVVIDGFISSVAALSAVRLNPLIREYLIPSHLSKEIGYNIAMKELNLDSMINLDMRLGEGSGCPIAFSIVQYSCAMMNNMATFEEAKINPSYLETVRSKDSYIVEIKED
ncbi:nicotinate-nucleotide--dimethylbenzimidazole phosphoribosyltransferase [Clostridium chauvoei]|uniref:nicotinate-nucleotide--dimethylbenzimidazole phosphoribosyltransferase n=1 Tax=Clostridium chauvoei TaxID=46867 RepID=UPI001C852649|nr:nicotinate-nucleotide--dimethylbenzimidazole phosphoribosyltransferase [Clostridium chauvoei]MBX7394538.1 nicotinate-nucleotide--dimethylbenzimidazole phosphoribosyltransferase [Clostridium chauvoei]